MAKSKFPKGAITRAAKRLGLNRIYVWNVVANTAYTTERTLEITKIVGECADAILQERRARNQQVREIQNKYAISAQ